MRTLVEMPNSGEVALLRCDKYVDLNRMYNLYGKVKFGLDIVREIMSTHIKECGLQLVQDPEKLKDPVVFVRCLLELRDKYENIIKKAFNDDKNFRNALNHVT